MRLILALLLLCTTAQARTAESDVAVLAAYLDAIRGPVLPDTLEQRPRVVTGAATYKYTPAVWIFTDPTWCPGCRAIDGKLSDALDAMEDKGWKVVDSTSGKVSGSPHVVYVGRINSNKPPAFIDEILGDDWAIPALVYWDGSKVVRSWTPGCKRPVDVWTLDWLYTGVDKRPRPLSLQAGGKYPLRSGWWSVDDVWNASRSFVLNHLQRVGIHGGKFDSDWLASLSRAELHSLHSDDHERRVRWEYVERKAARAPPVRSCPSGGCPSGQCPLSRSTRRR